MTAKCSAEVYNNKIKSVFADLKSSESYDELILNSIKLENGNGYLICVSKFHLNDKNIIEIFAKWRKEAKTFHNKFDVTFESTQKWLKNLLLDIPDRILFIVLNRYGHPIGHMGFANSINSDKFMELDNVVRGVKMVEPGIMSIATKALLNWAAFEFCPDSFHLRTLDNNDHALRFYSKLGFEEYSRQPLKLIGNDVEFNYIPIVDEKNITPDRFFVCMKIRP